METEQQQIEDSETYVPPVPKGRKTHPLLTPRMVRAYARTMGCLEDQPDVECDHRIIATRQLTALVERYEQEPA